MQHEHASLAVVEYCSYSQPLANSVTFFLIMDADHAAIGWLGSRSCSVCCSYSLDIFSKLQGRRPPTSPIL